MSSSPLIDVKVRKLFRFSRSPAERSTYEEQHFVLEYNGGLACWGHHRRVAERNGQTPLHAPLEGRLRELQVTNKNDNNNNNKQNITHQTTPLCSSLPSPRIGKYFSKGVLLHGIMVSSITI